MSKTFFAVCVALICAAHITQADEPSRPNIIFLLTDDQRDNSFGAMGHPFVKTPNVDRLLRQSVRFSNTYIAEPTCSPSRVALLTGMHERVNGVGFTSSYQLTEAQWRADAIPLCCGKAGYYTGFIGKFGVEYYTFKGQAGTGIRFLVRLTTGGPGSFPRIRTVPVARRTTRPRRT